MSYCSIYGTSSFCVYRSSMFSSTMLWWKTFWGERPRCPPPSCTVTSTASSRPTQQAARSWRSSSGWEIKDTSGISQATRIGVDSDPFHFRRFNLLVLHCCSLMVILSSFHIYIFVYLLRLTSSWLSATCALWSVSVPTKTATKRRTAIPQWFPVSITALSTAWSPWVLAVG